MIFQLEQLDSPHILDLVITDKESVENIDYLAPMGKSDHSVLLIYANSHANNTDPIPKLNLNKGNYSELRKNKKKIIFGFIASTI